MLYAENTTVPVEKSRLEIERVLTKYGASSFAYACEDSPDKKSSRAMVAFVLKNIQIRIILSLPSKDLKRFWVSPSGRNRYSADKAAQMWEQGCRQSWRALALVVKAKLEAVSSGITTVEQEFLAHIVLPNGQTFGGWAKPELEKIKAGNMPLMLPMSE